jgi:phytoene dehydrogenase-like protein
MSAYDAVIIGSGHNGLITAAYLARAGWKVAVVERNETIGGAVATRELTLPGFKHDPFAASHVLFYGSPIYQELGKELEQYGLKYKIANHSFASLFPDGDSISCYANDEKTLVSLSRQSANDAASWKELLATFGDAQQGFGGMLYNDMPSFGTIKSIYNIYKKLKKDRFLEFAQMLLKTPKHMAEAYFENEKVRTWFASWAYHPDFGPNTALGSMFAYSTIAALQYIGNPVPEGGSGKMVEALGKLVESYGGHIYTNSPVKKIHLRNHIPVMVETADRTLEAKKAVIACLEPKQLYMDLIGEENLPAGFVKKVKRYRFGDATFKMDLALNSAPNWIAGKEVGDACYLHLAPYTDDIVRTAYASDVGLLPDSPLVIIGQQSAVDPTRAPEGKHTLWVQVRSVPYHIKGDLAGQIQGTDWDQIKDQYANRIMKKIAEYAPGIESQLLGQHVMSPKDLERANPNIREGCIVSGSHQIDQNFLFRPFPGYSRYNTPFKKLYMIGAATWPGSALHGASGYMLAKKLLR